jgi:beta-lactamase regulating signal transducer with metallopeptidase domain/WD40 repeat protein
MNWFPLIIVSVQVSLVAALGLLAAKLLTCAAHRHSVLLAALLCILGSPLFYVGVAATGFFLNLPAVFPVSREDVAAAALARDFASTQEGKALPVLPDPTEFAETAVADSPTRTAASPADPVQRQHNQVDRFPLRTDYILAGFWLAGTLLSLAGVLRSQLKTQFILKSAHPVGKKIHPSLIAETERRVGAAKGLLVAITGKVAGPAVVGIFQPWILIPGRYLETLSRDELLQVLIHEGAHAVRRDPLVALVQRIAGALFWWHPLVYLVNRELTRAREEVCDNFVLTHAEPETYGATLLRLATLSPAMARLPLSIGMFDGPGELEERIRGLLDSRRKIMTHVRFLTGASVLGAFALFSLAVAAARVGAQNPANAPPVAPAVAEKAWPAVKQDFITATQDEDKPIDVKVGAADDDDYRRLHDRYRALILAAAKASKKDEVAKLTDKFNESIGGKLLSVQVVLRVGLIADHTTLFSKFFDTERNIGIVKPNFATSDKPIVWQNHDGQGVVLIATNPLGENKWPDDLQVTLVMDNVAKKDIQEPPPIDVKAGAPVPAANGAAPEFGLGKQQDVVQWSHDSQRLYAAGSFSKLTVWEHQATGWKPLDLKAEHHVNSLAASRKSPLLVAGTNVGTAEVWDPTTQKRRGDLRSSPNYSVYAVAVSADDKLIAVCGTDGTVHVFDRELSKPLTVLGEKADTRMASLAFAPDGKTLAAMDRYGHLVLWKLSDGTPLTEWKNIAGEDCSVQWKTDGKQLAVSGWGKVTIVAAEKGSQPHVVEAPEAVIDRHSQSDDFSRSGPEPGGIKFASVTAIAPDFRSVASVAPDASIGIWDLATRKIVRTLPAPAKVAIMDSQSAGLRNMVFSPNGQRLACTTLRGEVVFWQLTQAAVVAPADKQLFGTPETGS